MPDVKIPANSIIVGIGQKLLCEQNSASITFDKKGKCTISFDINPSYFQYFANEAGRLPDTHIAFKDLPNPKIIVQDPSIRIIHGAQIKTELDVHIEMTGSSIIKQESASIIALTDIK